MDNGYISGPIRATSQSRQPNIIFKFPSKKNIIFKLVNILTENTHHCTMYATNSLNSKAGPTQFVLITIFFYYFGSHGRAFGKKKLAN